MRIENEAAGSVIGKGGQKVGEIRKISGAQVNLSISPSSSYFAFYSGAHFNRRGTDSRRRANGDPNRNS